MIDRRTVLRGLSGMAGVGLAGCLEGTDAMDGTGTTATPTRTGETPVDELTLSSPAFDDGGTIPSRYTFEGADVSPPLSIAGVPDAAESLVVVVDDVDADAFTHWLLWGVPPDTRRIPESIGQHPRAKEIEGAKQGTNGFGELGYRGPRPPESEGAHTYRFRLFAVESPINVQAGATRGRVDSALEDGVVATAQLTGEFDR